MITYYRTSSFSSVRAINAMTVAREIAAYIKRTTGTDVVVEVPVGGNPFRIRWSFHFTDLAAFDAFVMALRSDPTYTEMVAKSGENFIAASASDEIWRTV